MTEVAAGGKTTLEESVEYFPHMAALDPDTVVTVFREYKPKNELVEYTVFYREPGKEKMRIDAELKDTDLVSPRNIKIIRWGKAIGAR